MNTKRNMAQIIIEGFQLLEKEKALQQVDVIAKMNALGFKISRASFSNIINGKNTGVKVLKIASEGILTVIKAELGYFYNSTTKSFEHLKNWKKVDIPKVIQTDTSIVAPTFHFHDKGRLTIQQKVTFMQKAQKEVIELGVRLNTFVNYFFSRNEYEFRRPVEDMIRSGIHIKLFLIDPDCNEARLYFQDRAKMQPEELESIEIIKKVRKKLNTIYNELNNISPKGKFEVYSYKHIPYCHFLIADGKYSSGKLFVSNYLYGVRRADSPVLEISKRYNYDLYERYYSSFKALTRNAKKLDFS